LPWYFCILSIFIVTMNAVLLRYGGFRNNCTTKKMFA
jgi:hypothetical protein